MFKDISLVELNKDDFDHPLELFYFIESSRGQRKIAQYNYQEILSKFKEKIKLEKYLNSLSPEMRQKYLEEQRKEMEANFKKQQEENRLNAQLKELEGSIREYKKKYYVNLIIEKGEQAVKEYEVAIKDKLAVNKEEFVKRLILACFKMDCNSNLKNTFLKENNDDLDFEYDGVSPIHFLIQNNRFDEIKKAKLKKPEIKLTDNDKTLSLHLSDFKIFNYLFENYINSYTPSTSDYAFDEVVLKKSLPVNRLTEALIMNAKKVDPGMYYTTYFLDKNKTYKANHELGNFRELSYVDNQIEKAKELKIKTNLKELPFYAFESPEWESKKIELRNKSGEYLESASAKQDKEGWYVITFFEIKNKWLGIKVDNKIYWVHPSQMDKVTFIEEEFNDARLGDINLNELYQSLGGAKIPSTKSSNYGSFISRIISMKWVNGDLWFNVDLTNQYNDSVQENKIDVKDVWLKGYTDGYRNFQHYIYGC